MKTSIKNKYGVRFLALGWALCLWSGLVWAHGGEDHSTQKVAVAPAGGGLTTRVARAGDYEITLKLPSLEPDKQTAARLFVTRYDTNEAAAKANVTLLLQAEGASTTVVQEGATPGLYEVKLPPLRAGTVAVAARLTVNGATETANFGAVTVAAPTVAAPTATANGARMALILLGVLALVGALAWLLWRAKRRTPAVTEQNAVTA